MPKKPRSSRLSLNTAVHRLKEENQELREALEDIADILESVGIIEPGELEEEGLDPDTPQDVIEGTAEHVEEERSGESIHSERNFEKEDVERDKS